MSLQEEFTVRDLARAFDVGENYIFTLCRFVENKIPSDLFELLDKQAQ